MNRIKGNQSLSPKALLKKAKFLFPLNIYDYRDTVGYLHFTCNISHLQIVDFLTSQGLPFGQGDVFRCIQKINEDLDAQEVNKAIELADRVMAQRESGGG